MPDVSLSPERYNCFSFAIAPSITRSRGGASMTCGAESSFLFSTVLMVKSVTSLPFLSRSFHWILPETSDFPGEEVPHGSHAFCNALSDPYFRFRN